MTEPPIFERGADKSNARLEEDAARRPVGRPPIPYDGKVAGLVSLLASYRIPQERIARSLGMDAKTMRALYADALENAETLIDAEVLTAWMKLVRKCDPLTVNRYVERKFRFSDDTGGITSALPNVTVIDNIPNEEPAPAVTDAAGE